MNLSPCKSWWHACPWTLALAALMAVLNLGLWQGMPVWAEGLLTAVEFDRQAIFQGEWWRILTGNLVHWSVEHFLLDVGAFLLIGLLYERALGRLYPWLLLAAGLAVGGGVFLFRPDLELYRGLSGVDSGQFAAALMVEMRLARRAPRRWWWVLPAVVLFVVKLAYECLSGQMFFGTEALGDIGLPVPLAHAAGALAAVACWAVEPLARRVLPDALGAVWRCDVARHGSGAMRAARESHATASP